MSNGPILLGMDASTGICSVALLYGDAVIGRTHAEGLGHASSLLMLTDQLLSEAGVERSAIDAIAVTRGPGGFTGVRIGVGVAQGLAMGLDRPVIALSTLQVVAETARAEAAEDAIDGWLVLQDARMQEVYGGFFRCSAEADGCIEAWGEEWLGPVRLPEMPSGRWVGVGSGFAVYADAFADSGRGLAMRPDILPSMAAAMPAARRLFDAGAFTDPGRFEPVYLRNRVADPPRG